MNDDFLQRFAADARDAFLLSCFADRERGAPQSIAAYVRRFPDVDQAFI